MNLDSRLQKDTYELGYFGDIKVLLHKNSLVLWIILVPDTDQIELCDLEDDKRGEIYEKIHQVSLWMKRNFKIDKINIASIGNVVPQIHIHVIGRKKTDLFWPGVVWGRNETDSYHEKEFEEIQRKFQELLI